VPWMWSDQYELTIQIAGFPDQGVRTVERTSDDAALVLFHLAGDGRLVASSGIGPNAAIGRVIRLGQMMIERGLHPDPAALADPAVNLKTLMRERAARSGRRPSPANTHKQKGSARRAEATRLPGPLGHGAPPHRRV